MNRYDDISTVDELFHLTKHNACSTGELALGVFMYVVPDRNRMTFAKDRIETLRLNGYKISWLYNNLKHRDHEYKEYTVLISKVIDEGEVTAVLGTKTPEVFYTECFKEGDIVRENTPVVTGEIFTSGDTATTH